MTNQHAIHFTDQLRQHLRALRKQCGLTQAQVGAVMGVSQARVAEIEANPGLVNFEQVLQLLSVIGVTLTLHEGPPADVAEHTRQNAGQYTTDPPAHGATYVRQEPDAIYSVQKFDAPYRAGETSVPEIAAVAAQVRPTTSKKQTMPAPEQAVPPVAMRQSQRVDDAASASVSRSVARSKKGVW